MFLRSAHRVNEEIRRDVALFSCSEPATARQRSTGRNAGQNDFARHCSMSGSTIARIEKHSRQHGRVRVLIGSSESDL
jgi:hypothetical protein